MLPRQWAQYWGHIGLSCIFINSTILSTQRRELCQYWASIRATRVRLLGTRLIWPVSDSWLKSWRRIGPKLVRITGCKICFIFTRKSYQYCGHSNRCHSKRSHSNRCHRKHCHINCCYNKRCHSDRYYSNRCHKNRSKPTIAIATVLIATVAIESIAIVTVAIPTFNLPTVTIATVITSLKVLYDRFEMYRGLLTSSRCWGGRVGGGGGGSWLF